MISQLVSMLIVLSTWELFHRLVDKEMDENGFCSVNNPMQSLISDVMDEEARRFREIYPECCRDEKK